MDWPTLCPLHTLLESCRGEKLTTTFSEHPCKQGSANALGSPSETHPFKVWKVAAKIFKYSGPYSAVAEAEIPAPCPWLCRCRGSTIENVAFFLAPLKSFFCSLPKPCTVWSSGSPPGWFPNPQGTFLIVQNSVRLGERWGAGILLPSSE